jgi:hypothetical protein
MPKVPHFTEFLATREQFALTDRARWEHAKSEKPPELPLRFVNDPNPPTTFELNPPAVETVRRYVECWYVRYTLPALMGDEPLDFLVVKTKDDQWLYAARLGLFFRMEMVEVGDELP